jgi:hypothetical protein
MTEQKKYAEFDAMLRAERRQHYLHQLSLVATFGAFLAMIYGLATFSWYVLGAGGVVLAAAYGAGIIDKRRQKPSS